MRKVIIGRTLVAKGRSSKQVKLQPVFDKTVQKRGGPGAEKSVEVANFVNTCLVQQNANIGNADGGPALQNAIKNTGTPSTKAKHNQEIYTPTCRLYKRHLSKKQDKTLKSLVQKGQAIEMMYFYKVIGGDNGAESVCGHLKNTQRRVNLTAGPVKNANINMLSSQWLLEKPTLGKLLEAMKCFIHAANGQNPTDSLTTYSNEWLFADVYEKSTQASGVNS